MAYYAFITNGIVTEVIPGKDENELLDGLTPEQWYGNYRCQTCIRTSYNGNIRKNFAGKGMVYDPIRDAFYSQKPKGSIGFNEETCQWIMPISEVE